MADALMTALNPPPARCVLTAGLTLTITGNIHG